MILNSMALTLAAGSSAVMASSSLILVSYIVAVGSKAIRHINKVCLRMTHSSVDVLLVGKIARFT